MCSDLRLGGGLGLGSFDASLGKKLLLIELFLRYVHTMELEEYEVLKKCTLLNSANGVFYALLSNITMLI